MAYIWAALLSVDSIVCFGNMQSTVIRSSDVRVWEWCCIFRRPNAHADFTAYGRFESLMHYIRQHSILLHFILFYWQDCFACFKLKHPTFLGVKFEPTMYYKWDKRWRLSLFWDVTQRRLVVIYWRFGNMVLFPFSGFSQSSWTAWTLKMGLIGCPETSTTDYPYALCNIQEEPGSHSEGDGSLGSGEI